MAKMTSPMCWIQTYQTLVLRLRCIKSYLFDVPFCYHTLKVYKFFWFDYINEHNCVAWHENCFALWPSVGLVLGHVLFCCWLSHIIALVNKYLTEVFNVVLLVFLLVHTSHSCLCHRTSVEDIRLSLSPWNSLDIVNIHNWDILQGVAAYWQVAIWLFCAVD